VQNVGSHYASPQGEALNKVNVTLFAEMFLLHFVI